MELSRNRIYRKKLEQHHPRTGSRLHGSALVMLTGALCLAVLNAASALGQNACDAEFACKNHCNAQTQPKIQECLNNRGDVVVPKGQTLQQVCNNQAHAEVTSCLNHCPDNCYPATVEPDFMLISILYAPPGNKSTTAFGTSQQAGTTQTESSNFSQSTQTTGDFSYSVSVLDSKAGDDLGYSFTIGSGSQSSSGVTVTTTTTSGNNLASTTDLINHDQDVFLLWVNPEQIITQTGLNAFQLLTQSRNKNGYVDVFAVTVEQLKNGIPQKHLEDQQLCPNSVCFTVPGLHVLTDSDKAQILAMDPFLSWKPDDVPSTKDPARFRYIETMPLENLTDSGGVTFPFQISDLDVISQTEGTTQSHGNSITSGVSLTVGGIGFSDKATDSWTWSVTDTTGQSSGSGQQTSVTLSSNTPGCCSNASGNGVCEVDVYEDMAYRTFAFRPEPETCAMPAATTIVRPTPLLTGIIKCAKSPCRQLVSVKDVQGKLIRKIWTDSKGRYSVGAVAAGPLKITIGSTTKTVNVKQGNTIVMPTMRVVQ